MKSVGLYCLNSEANLKVIWCMWTYHAVISNVGTSCVLNIITYSQESEIENINWLKTSVLIMTIGWNQMCWPFLWKFLWLIVRSNWPTVVQDNYSKFTKVYLIKHAPHTACQISCHRYTTLPWTTTASLSPSGSQTRSCILPPTLKVYIPVLKSYIQTNKKILVLHPLDSLRDTLTYFG